MRPIAISLSPNTEKDDVFLAIKTLISPRKWFAQNEVEKLEKEFVSLFGKGYKAITVNSGRSALYLILKALGVKKADEVAIQAFTCVAVPNSILWLGGKPVYVDIDGSYNMDPNDLERKISAKTRAIVIQHTFGIPANVDLIKKVARSHGLALVEDCAHSLGATYNNKMVGTLGDVAFFSFGRDKVLSSVFGGIILCSKGNLNKVIKKIRDELPSPSAFWTLQQLLHPPALQLILPVYNLGLGKAILLLLQKANLLSKAIYEEERVGERPKVFPQKMSGGLAALARNQLAKLDKFNYHRRKIAKFYFAHLAGKDFVLPPKNLGSSWLRFPIRHPKAFEIYKFAKKRGILLGDWYRGVIPPLDNLSTVDYQKGSCPRAEVYSKEVINLPTYPRMTLAEAERVIEVLDEWRNTR